MTDWERLVRLVDDLEGRAAHGYVTLPEVEHGYGAPVTDAIAAAILLVDHRHMLIDGQPKPVTLCRLNRHHPEVERLTRWEG